MTGAEGQIAALGAAAVLPVVAVGALFAALGVVALYAWARS